MEITSEMLDCLEEHGMGWFYDAKNNNYVSIDSSYLYLYPAIYNMIEGEVTLRDLANSANKKFKADPNNVKANYFHGDVYDYRNKGAAGGFQGIKLYFGSYETVPTHEAVPCVAASYVVYDAEGNYINQAKKVLNGIRQTLVFNPSQLEVLRKNGFEVPKCKIF